MPRISQNDFGMHSFTVNKLKNTLGLVELVIQLLAGQTLADSLILGSSSVPILSQNYMFSSVKKSLSDS